jgi:hypothetical protein
LSVFFSAAYHRYTLTFTDWWCADNVVHDTGERRAQIDNLIAECIDKLTQ